MAQFHINQRVRVISQASGERLQLVGEEGVIVGYDDAHHPKQHPWIVRLSIRDARGMQAPDEWCFSADHLAPLLPPDEAADAFLARLKKLGSEPVNDAPKVEVTK